MSELGNYQVWADDNMVYGPVTAAVLRQWVMDNRVEAATWVYCVDDRAWRRAGEVDELQELFEPRRCVSFSDRLDRGVALCGVTHEALRQFPLFACLSDEDLAQFVGYAELCEARDEELIVKQGDPGDAIYFVLEGKVRVRLMLGVEKILGRIPAGEFFGEMVMFRQGTRSADVVSEGEARLLRLSLGAFKLLMAESPSLAVPLLFGLGRTMSARLAEDDRRFEQDVETEFHWVRN